MLAIVVITLVVSCVWQLGSSSGGAGGHVGPTATDGPSVQGARPQTTASGAAADVTQSSSKAAAGQASDIGSSSAGSPRKIIEQASLSINLPDLQKSSDKISSLVSQMKGFVESEQRSGIQSQAAIQMTARIPEAQFSSFLDNVRALGDVTSFSQTGQDVTQQYNGLQSSIAQLQDEAGAYTRLYNKAQSMQDMLQIQQSLSQVNGRLADLQAQLHDMGRSVDLATVTLSLTSTPTAAANIRGIPVVDTFQHSVLLLAHTFARFVTVMAWLAPWAFVIGIIASIWWAWKRRWRRRRQP